MQARRGGEGVARARLAVRQAVVTNARLVVCTLSSAGGDLATLVSKSSHCFDALIIDEVSLRVQGVGYFWRNQMRGSNLFDALIIDEVSLRIYGLGMSGAVIGMAPNQSSHARVKDRI